MHLIDGGVSDNLALRAGGAAMQPLLGDIALFVALLMAAFAVLFGTRHVDATEHQDGLMLAIATESIIKLVAFLAVGIFVTGVVAGFVLVASWGIRREEKQGPFLADETTGGVNWAARRLSGLYIRRQIAPARRAADLRTGV